MFKQQSLLFYGLLAITIVSILNVKYSLQDSATTTTAEYGEADLMNPEAKSADKEWAQQSRYWLERLLQPNELKAVCSMHRKPELTRDPDLYLYSTGRDGSIQISLDLTVEMYDGKEADFGLKWMQAQEIQRKLLDSGAYNESLSTYFIVHGYLGSYQDEWMHILKDRILNQSKANVFLVDWSGGSRPKFLFDYGLAVRNSQVVTVYLSAFIKNLVSLTASKELDNFHLIGYSLGAQIVGNIGYHLDGAVGRITALDPAGPCFQRNLTSIGSLDARLTGMSESTHERRRLSASSAKLVIAIHTDIELLGLNENCAHYDIYINGGSHQVNCTETQPGCNHEACLRIVLPPAPILLGPSDEGQHKSDKSGKCSLMAYQCSSWQAYQAGECAFCKDDDARCIFTGLSLTPYSQNITNTDIWRGNGLNQYDVESESINSDIVFNNEQNPSAPNQVLTNSLDIRDSARHFTKAGIDKSICLYQYQIMVVADFIEDRKVANDIRFYLELPLPAYEGAPRIRLVQISHLISGSLSKSILTESLSHRAGYPITDNTLDYYTALISFNSTDDCSEIQSDRVLCQPMDRIQEAQLYSPDPEVLHRVQYVTINYMSGNDKKTRDSNSQILQSRSDDGVLTLTGQAAQDQLSQVVKRSDENFGSNYDSDTLALLTHHINVVSLQ